MANYSSPVPVIGLYIAAASLVCFLLMFYDIVAGFRTRKPWFPCKLFSLNSVILTLLSVATKLPVDLTTSMPGPQDQLSKLSGTAFICISMSFLMPSLGNNTKSECLTNTAATSILVITVVVNICIQMFTGVISLFTVEHIIILCCMLLLLPLLWQAAFDIDYVKSLHIGTNKAKLKFVDDSSMLERLMGCYIHGYGVSPQLVLCRQPYSATMAGLCIICLAVLMQAIIRYLILKPLKSSIESSDYGWSIWPILVTQTLVVIVGSLVTSSRWYTLSNQIPKDSISHYRKGEDFNRERSNSLLRFHIQSTCRWIFVNFIDGVVFLVYRFIIRPLMLVFSLLGIMIRMLHSFGIFKHPHRDSALDALILVDGQLMRFGHDSSFRNWSKDRCMVNMKRWMEIGISESLVHLNQLLSRTSPSEQYHQMGFSVEDDIQVCFLSVVLLVRIADVCIPTVLSASLKDTFREAYEFIHFVDDKINSEDAFHEQKCKVADAVWIGTDFSILLTNTCGSSTHDGMSQTQSDLDRAVVIIDELKNILPRDDFLFVELRLITYYLTRRMYSTIQDLYDYMEQFFVDMLHVYLAQLPNVIFKEVAESSAEEYEEKVKFALKLVAKIGSLEERIQWSFPGGYGISRLTVPVYFVPKSQNCTLTEGDAHVGAALDNIESVVII